MTLDMVVAMRMIAAVMIVVMRGRESCVKIVKRVTRWRAYEINFVWPFFAATVQLFASRRWMMRMLIRLLVEMAGSAAR